MRLVIYFCTFICTYTLTQVSTCTCTNETPPFVAEACVELSYGSNLPPDESGMPSTDSMSILKSEAHCSSHFLSSSSLLYVTWLSSAASWSLMSVTCGLHESPTRVEHGNMSICKAKAAGDYGSSTQNRANVASENGSPSWNATGKGGVICPLPFHINTFPFLVGCPITLGRAAYASHSVSFFLFFSPASWTLDMSVGVGRYKAERFQWICRVLPQCLDYTCAFPEDVKLNVTQGNQL